MRSMVPSTCLKKLPRFDRRKNHRQPLPGMSPHSFLQITKIGIQYKPEEGLEAIKCNALHRLVGGEIIMFVDDEKW